MTTSKLTIKLSTWRLYIISGESNQPRKKSSLNKMPNYLPYNVTLTVLMTTTVKDTVTVKDQTTAVRIVAISIMIARVTTTAVNIATTGSQSTSRNFATYAK